MKRQVVILNLRVSVLVGVGGAREPHRVKDKKQTSVKAGECITTWRGVGRSNYQYTDRTELYGRFFFTTYTSSASERNFSTWGFIHSEIWNRLYDEQLNKLVYVFQIMRILRKLKNPNYQEP